MAAYGLTRAPAQLLLALAETPGPHRADALAQRFGRSHRGECAMPHLVRVRRALPAQAVITRRRVGYALRPDVREAVLHAASK